MISNAATGSSARREGEAGHFLSNVWRTAVTARCDWGGRPMSSANLLQSSGQTHFAEALTLVRHSKVRLGLGREPHVISHLASKLGTVRTVTSCLPVRLRVLSLLAFLFVCLPVRYFLMDILKWILFSEATHMQWVTSSWIFNSKVTRTQWVTFSPSFRRV